MLFLLLPVVFLATACSSTPIRDMGLDKLAPRKAEQELSAGLKNYENGHYQMAAKYLQNALNNGLTFKSDQVTAHKYLAFIDCVSEREKQCREQFKRALEINPGFELSAAEAGHPIWGPVFRKVQAEQSQQKR
ncbi:TssQ family T6SS-associated lipoprotein [Sulfuriferula plumbiphila]|uniref:TssQ family T6SS-associated lipoprotein n=1 Tax=Sulfuriferula plumbiphila TaxID=171865 RepID=UPI001CB8AC50|nr:TssQ family T6SS-associated lipoprotein [Sulfuriferula plumbiphila]